MFRSFFTVLFVLGGIFLFTKFLGPIPFSVTSVTTTKQSLFTASGTGEATAIPDTAMVQLGVSKTNTTVENAQSQVNVIINKITQDMKQLGVDAKDIKTVNYSVNPDYDYNSGQQKLKGYVVNADVQMKLKTIEKANNAIDIATKDGATQVGGVQFVLDDNKKDELETQARQEAITKAKQKAESIAKAAGIKLGRIVDIQENEGGQPPMQYAAPMALSKTADTREQTQLNPGENKVSITVTLSYETY